MARYEDLKKKYPNYKFNGNKPYVNEEKFINQTVLIEKNVREIGYTISDWIGYLDTLKDKYPQFNKIHFSMIGNNNNCTFIIIGDMLETDEQYDARIIAENEKVEFYNLYQERKQQQRRQEEIDYYADLFKKFEGKNPNEL